MCQYFCDKKIGLLEFRCRCGGRFCWVHRFPEEHECRYDYKNAASDDFVKLNPICKSDKSDPQTEVAKLSRLPKPPRQTLTPPQSNTHLDDFEDIKSVAGLSPQPSRAESTTEPSPQSSRRRAEGNLHGAMAVTWQYERPLHTRYPPVVGVAWQRRPSLTSSPHESDRCHLLCVYPAHRSKIYNGKKAALNGKALDFLTRTGTYEPEMEAELQRVPDAHPYLLLHTYFNGVFLNPEGQSSIYVDAEATGSRLQHQDGTKFSQMFRQLESQPEIGCGRREWLCRDDDREMMRDDGEVWGG
ncbi:A20/AN1-like zinc finger family protein [Tanacetum coccineum]